MAIVSNGWDIHSPAPPHLGTIGYPAWAVCAHPVPVPNTLAPLLKTTKPSAVKYSPILLMLAGPFVPASVLCPPPPQTAIIPPTLCLLPHSCRYLVIKYALNAIKLLLNQILASCVHLSTTA